MANSGTEEIKNAIPDIAGEEVHRKYTAGAGNVALQNYSFPEQWYVQIDASTAADATDNTVIYTSGDVSMYNYHTIECVSATDPVTVQVSIDGTSWSGDFAITGVTATPSIATGEFGVLAGKFQKIRVLKNGTTNEVNAARISHGNS